MNIRAKQAFNYHSKCHLKENVSRGRCQDAYIGVNLAFDHQSKCMLLVGFKFKKTFSLFDKVTIDRV